MTFAAMLASMIRESWRLWVRISSSSNCSERGCAAIQVTPSERLAVVVLEPMGWPVVEPQIAACEQAEHEQRGYLSGPPILGCHFLENGSEPDKREDVPKAQCSAPPKRMNRGEVG